VDPDELLTNSNLVNHKDEASKEKSFENPFNQGTEMIAAEQESLQEPVFGM